jgi:hypothetical protein
MFGLVNGDRVIWSAAEPGTDVKRDRIFTDSWYGGTLRLR